MEKSNKIVLKVVLMGESNLLNLGMVGKTSIFTRFTKGVFPKIDIKNRTVEACVGSKNLKIDGKSFTINVWDTAGEEKYHALTPLYYRDADGAVLVFDLTKRETFDQIEKWVMEIRNVVKGSFQFVICGNKCDLLDYQVDDKDIKLLAERFDADYFTVSAKMDKNLSDAFTTLASKIHTEKTRPPVKKKKSVKILLNEGKPSSKKENDNCC